MTMRFIYLAAALCCTDGTYVGGERSLIVDHERFRLQKFRPDDEKSGAYVFDGADTVGSEPNFNQVTIGTPRWTDKLSDLSPLCGLAGYLERIVDVDTSMSLVDNSVVHVEANDSLSFGFTWPDSH